MIITPIGNDGRFFDLNEGFLPSGAAKSDRKPDCGYNPLNTDWTVNYAGWEGHMAFYPKAVVGERLIRVDYGKYIAVGKEFTF